MKKADPQVGFFHQSSGNAYSTPLLARYSS